MADEKFFMRWLAAVVLDAGGEVTLPIEDYNFAGDFTIEFDPELPLNGDPEPGTLVTFKAVSGVFTEDDLEDDEDDY